MKQTKLLKISKRDGGITLISLIVCIIILIILASVLINMSLDNVKIVDTAVDSSKLYVIEQYQGTIEEGMQKEILEEAVLRRERNTKYCKKRTKRDRKHRNSNSNNRSR